MVKPINLKIGNYIINDKNMGNLINNKKNSGDVVMGNSWLPEKKSPEKKLLKDSIFVLLKAKEVKLNERIIS